MLRTGWVVVGRTTLVSWSSRTPHSGRVSSVGLLSSPTVPALSSVQLPVLCFVIAFALLAWRVWVGVRPKARWLVLGLFAATFLLLAGSRRALGIDNPGGEFYGAASVYTACLLVTRGRPERMLEVWKVSGEPPPSRAERRSVTMHQIAFCALVVSGALVYFWAVGDLR